MATQRNPGNVLSVVDGQVLLSFEADPKIGLDGTFGDEWETGGILNDGSKVELNRVIDKNKTPGWGFGVVAVSTKAGELTGSCEVLERNATVEKVAWPNKTSDGVLIHDSVVARPHVAYVEVLEDGSQRIRATRHPAYATIEDLGFQEEVAGKTMSFDFMTGAQKDAFDELIIGATESEAATVQRIRFDESANTAP